MLFLLLSSILCLSGQGVTDAESDQLIDQIHNQEEIKELHVTLSLLSESQIHKLQLTGY